MRHLGHHQRFPSMIKEFDSEVAGSSQKHTTNPTKTKNPNYQERGDGLKVEELDIDFRVPILSHAVVKQAENFCVCELVKKIESHPHRGAPQADFAAEQRLQPIQQ